VDDLYFYRGVAGRVSGGEIDALLALNGATVNVTGGSINRLRTDSDSQAVVSNGHVGRLTIEGGAVSVLPGVDIDYVDITGGSVSIDGAVVHQSADIASGGTLTVIDGRFESYTTAEAGATLDIHGGDFLYGLRTRAGATATISGGGFDHGFLGLSSYGDTTLVGSDFYVDGQPVTAGVATAVTVTRDVVGVFPNGKTFAFSRSDGDGFATSGVSFKLQASSLPAPMPGLFYASESTSLGSVRAGQTLVVDAGSVVPGGLGVVGGELVVQPGGRVEGVIEVAQGQAIIDGGELTKAIKAFSGGVVTFRAGTHDKPSSGTLANALSGGVLKVEGGSVETVETNEGEIIVSGGTVQLATSYAGAINVSGGSIASLRLKARQIASGPVRASDLTLTGGEVSTLTVESGSFAWIGGGVLTNVVTHSFQPALTIAGGRIVGSVQARGGTIRILGGEWEGGLVTPADPNGLQSVTLGVYGVDFFLDGTPIEIAENQSLTVPITGGVLTARLTDGELFTMDLAQAPLHLNSLTLYAVDRLQGDSNDDGQVDAADYTTWRDATLTGDLVADADHDGVVGERDEALWRLRYGTNYTTMTAGIPEPTAGALAFVVLVAMSPSRRSSSNVY